MQITKINNNCSMTYGTKSGSFLNKSKRALTKEMKNYYASLHNEAKARLYYTRFEQTEHELCQFSDKDITNKPLKFVKFLFDMTKNKVASVYYDSKAYKAFPRRFYYSDNLNPERHYQFAGK